MVGVDGIVCFHVQSVGKIATSNGNSQGVRNDSGRRDGIFGRRHFGDVAGSVVLCGWSREVVFKSVYIKRITLKLWLCPGEKQHYITVGRTLIDWDWEGPHTRGSRESEVLRFYAGIDERFVLDANAPIATRVRRRAVLEGVDR